MVDFLSIAPPETRKELVTILDHLGQEQQVEIQAVDNTDLAKLARKHPGLRDVFKKNAAPEQRIIAFVEHAPAIVAAALGHLGEEAYEAAVKRLDPNEREKLIKRISAMSYGDGGDKENEAPLPTAAEIAAGATDAGSEAQ